MSLNIQDFIGIAEAAKHLGVSVVTMRRYVRVKGVPYYQPGGRLLFKVTELDQWMMKSRKGQRGVLISMSGGRR